MKPFKSYKPEFDMILKTYIRAKLLEGF
jgi:hypothetical protein